MFLHFHLNRVARIPTCLLPRFFSLLMCEILQNKTLVEIDDHQQGFKVSNLNLHYHLANPNVVTTPSPTNF
jgi:hypothetical protein